MPWPSFEIIVMTSIEKTNFATPAIILLAFVFCTNLPKNGAINKFCAFKISLSNEIFSELDKRNWFSIEKSEAKFHRFQPASAIV